MAARKKSAPASLVLSPSEVASLLGVCRKTVDRRIADGSLKAIRLGGIIRISRQSIDDLIAGAETPEVR